MQQLKMQSLNIEGLKTFYTSNVNQFYCMVHLPGTVLYRQMADSRTGQCRDSFRPYSKLFLNVVKPILTRPAKMRNIPFIAQ